jgi:cytochrome c peroxidase
MVNRQFVGVISCAVVALAAMVAAAGHPAAAGMQPATQDFANAAGVVRTLDVNGNLDRHNPFFQDLGTNGRSCATCHEPEAAWSITPESVRRRFADSRGNDPIFSNNDGSNCEGALPRSLGEKRDAYSLLLNRGLLRVGLDVPAGAEFVIDSVKDPYRCGPATTDASLYRRPLPATNLPYVTAVMWDGRESSANTSIRQDLARQANDATRGHAAATQDLTPEQVEQIVAFETGLFTAQLRDRQAGSLRAGNARGGPVMLSRQAFFIGINDPVGMNPSGAAFEANAFTLFDSWTRARGANRRETAARRAIARGQRLFNSKPIVISGVAGLNGETFPSGVTVPASFVGSCSVCHDAPNIGGHSVKAPLDIGLAAPSVARYLPVYTLRRLSTQETIRTTDPGRAMVSGKWQDIGKFKGPILRGLAARAPYFHNGSAASLEDVVDFYDSRFAIGLSRQERADLAAFLAAL